MFKIMRIGKASPGEMEDQRTRTNGAHELILKDEVYAIIGAAMEVHATLGHGFLESVYQEALEVELNRREIPFMAQAGLPILYKEHRLSKQFFADLVAYGQIIVELKAVSRLDSTHEAQVLNYLKASQNPLGLLINFGAPSLQWKRLVLSHPLQIRTTPPASL